MLSAGPDHFVTPNVFLTRMIKAALINIAIIGSRLNSSSISLIDKLLVEVCNDSKNFAPSMKTLAVMETRNPTITASIVCTSKVVIIFVFISYPFFRD